ALPVGVSPDTRTRPAPPLTWVTARAKAEDFSTSAKSSRTNGRIIAYSVYQPIVPLSGRLLEAVQHLQLPVRELVRQRCIAERRTFFLARGKHPVKKLNQGGF